MNERAAVSCDDFDVAADDLALGHAEEPRRSQLLAHAAGCARCGTLLDDLCAISDRLLHLAPQVEPPVGFEARAVARMVPAPAPSRAPGLARRRWMAAAAAATVVVLTAGIAVGRSGRAPTDAGTSGEILVSSTGARIGIAEIESGTRHRIVLTMDGASSWQGTWACELRDDDGRWVEVGRWAADDVTNHVWAAGIDASLADADRMRIRGSSGAVIAGAALRGD